MTLQLLDKLDHIAVALAGIVALTCLVIWGGLSTDVAVPIIATLAGVSSATAAVGTVKGSTTTTVVQAPPSGGSPTMGATGA